MEKTLRQVVVRPGEDGFWIAECISLPGCITQGATKQEAIVNIREAIQAYIAVLEEDHSAMNLSRRWWSPIIGCWTKGRYEGF